jgi:MFS family permease
MAPPSRKTSAVSLPQQQGLASTVPNPSSIAPARRAKSQSTMCFSSRVRSRTISSAAMPASPTPKSRVPKRSSSTSDLLVRQQMQNQNQRRSIDGVYTMNYDRPRSSMSDPFFVATNQVKTKQPDLTIAPAQEKQQHRSMAASFLPKNSAAVEAQAKSESSVAESLVPRPLPIPGRSLHRSASSPELRKSPLRGHLAQYPLHYQPGRKRASMLGWWKGWRPSALSNRPKQKRERGGKARRNTEPPPPINPEATFSGDPRPELPQQLPTRDRHVSQQNPVTPPRQLAPPNQDPDELEISRISRETEDLIMPILSPDPDFEENLRKSVTILRHSEGRRRSDRYRQNINHGRDTPPPVPPKDDEDMKISPDTPSTGILNTAKDSKYSSRFSLPEDNPPRPGLYPDPNPPTIAEEPLNGRTAYLHALTAFLVTFNCWGLANSFGLFQAFFSMYLLPSTDPSHIAWIGSTQLALVFGLGVPVSWLVVKGYMRWAFRSGAILMVLATVCSAWCKDLWSLWLVQGLVTGLGMGLVFCSGLPAILTWFSPEKLGMAMAIAASGSCVGGIVYVLIARHCLMALGYRTTMLILAGVMGGTMVPPVVVFRVRGGAIPSARTDQVQDQEMVGGRHSNWSWRAFVEPAYLLTATGLFSSFLGLYFGFVYIVSYASAVLELSDTAATNLLIFMLAANLPGRLLPGIISDRCIGPLNTLLPSLVLSAACIGLWVSLPEERAGMNGKSGVTGALTVVACFYGFVSAGIQALYAPIIHSFCILDTDTPPGLPATAAPNHDLEKGRDGISWPSTSTSTASEASHASAPSAASPSSSAAPPPPAVLDSIGPKTGGIQTCIGLACLIGTPIGGALINYRTQRGLPRPYLGAQIFALSALVLGFGLLLASRVVRRGWGAGRA